METEPAMQRGGDQHPPTVLTPDSPSRRSSTETGQAQGASLRSAASHDGRAPSTLASRHSTVVGGATGLNWASIKVRTRCYGRNCCTRLLLKCGSLPVFCTFSELPEKVVVFMAKGLHHPSPSAAHAFNRRKAMRAHTSTLTDSDKPCTFLHRH